MVVLSWKLFQDNIPTRERLSKCCVLVDLKEISCDIYKVFVEFVSHLFMTCELVTTVCYMIFMRLSWFYDSYHGS